MKNDDERKKEEKRKEKKTPMITPDFFNIYTADGGLSISILGYHPLNQKCQSGMAQNGDFLAATILAAV